MSEASSNAGATLPSDWKMLRLDEAFDVLDTRRKPLNRQDRAKIPGDVPYFGANGIVDRISEWLFDQPLVLMAEDGGYFDEYATRHIAYMVQGRCWVNNHAHVLSAKPGFSREWLYYNLVHRDIRPYINSGTRTKLNQADMRRIPIPIPPLPEQRKIAAILNSVDDVIEKTEAVIEQLQVVKKAMMQELLTRGIPGRHTRFKQTEIGEIPEEWEVVLVGELGDVIDPQPDHRTPPAVDAGVPYVGMGDISRDGRIHLESARTVSPEVLQKQIDSFALHAECFVFGKIGTIGQPVRLPRVREFALSANLIVLTSISRQNARWLFHSMQSEVVASQIRLLTNTTSQPALGIKKVRNLQVPRPTSDEMERILRGFEATDNRIIAEEQALSRLHDAKAALMSVLLTGELRVAPDESSA